MPKDASKQAHRGIGFVTFGSADPVEAVMSAPHALNGQELAIDRATPKEKVGASCMPALWAGRQQL
jgi:RNA-binding protein Musashi